MSFVDRLLLRAGKPLDSDILPREFKVRVSQEVDVDGNPVFNVIEDDLKSVGQIQPVKHKYVTRYIITGVPVEIPEGAFPDINLNELTPSMDKVISIKFSRISEPYKNVFVEKSPFYQERRTTTFPNQDIYTDEKFSFTEMPSKAFLKNLNIDDIISLKRIVQEDDLYRISRSFSKSLDEKSGIIKSTVVQKLGEPVIDNYLNEIIQLPKFPSFSEAKGLGEQELKVLETQTERKLAIENKVPKQRTPLSKTFGEQEQELAKVQRAKEILVKAVPPIPKAKFTPSNSLRDVPRMFGGEGLQEAAYTGTGMYEIYTSEAAVTRVGVIKPVQVQQPQYLVKQDIIVNQDFKQDLLSKQNLNVLSNQNELFKQDVQSKQIELQKQNQLQKQDQLFKQMQMQDSTLVDIYGSPNREMFGGEMISEGNNKKRKVKIRQVPTYNVLLRKHGKFQPIAYGLPKEEALRFGSNKALRDIARTFRITPTGKTTELFTGFNENPYVPNPNQFRGYKVRGGKIISTPDQFVQRTSANLQSYEEKSQIADAKRLSKIMKNNSSFLA
jgi:hypothetical protein